LLFELPIGKTVREDDLPAVLVWEYGKRLEILRFFDGGVTTTEHTAGDSVKFTPYYVLPSLPVAQDTATTSMGLGVDAIIAPIESGDSPTPKSTAIHIENASDITIEDVRVSGFDRAIHAKNVDRLSVNQLDVSPGPVVPSVPLNRAARRAQQRPKHGR
jgi:hypothetical protein